MFSLRTVAWLALILCHGSCKAARILGVITTPSFSHQLAYRPLWKELSLRGHQVVLLTTDLINDPKLINLTEVDMHDSYQFLSKMDFSDMFYLNDKFSPLTVLKTILNYTYRIERYQFNLEGVQNVIKNGEFDLVIAELLSPSAVAFGERFNCSIIGLTSMDAHELLHDVMGNPIHPILYPTQDIAYSVPTTFQQRLSHFIFKLFFKYHVYSIEVSFREPLKEYFHRQLPSFYEMAKRIKLILINANPVFYPVRPLTPGTVNVYGLHIVKAKPLPQDLQNFLDKATEGVVYISFGTNVNNKHLLGTNISEVLMETFRDLPYKVIWKSHSNYPQVNPDKMLIRKWFPQRDLLEHKNIKLFITQGGLQSMEEALHCRVPMIGIPFLGDQFNNVLRAQDNGIGLVIYRNDLTKEVLKKAVLEIIQEPRYKERITELAEIVKDRPTSALESAVWWTEHILRHKDFTHLKGAAVRATFNELYMLDVIFFLALIFILVLVIIGWIIITVTKLMLKMYRYKLLPNKIKKNS